MLFLSPRNSLDGQLHVIEFAKCNVFASPSLQPPSVKSILASKEMRWLSVPELEVWLDCPPVPVRPFTRTFEEVRHEAMIVMHSSGSTSLPKPIGYSFGCLAATWKQLEYETESGEQTLLRRAAAASRLFIGFPMFHAGGLFFPLALSVFAGVEIVLPSSNQPLSADLADEIHRYANCDAACLPPAIIEDLAKNPKHLNNLKPIKYIIYGGAPLSKTQGEIIQSVGPRIYNMLASTETGVVPSLDILPDDWLYFRPAPTFGITFRPHSDDLYEMFIVKDEKLKGRQGVFENFPELSEYSTQDLFRRHPDPNKQDHWMTTGRLDDVIVLLNGEKVNPTGMEKEIQTHPDVSAAIVFGRDRIQTALLVEPSKNIAVNTEEERRNFLDRLWPKIEKANDYGPSHGRLSRGLVMFTKADKPMPRTPKHNVIRNATYGAYAEEIDALYAAQECHSWEKEDLNSADDPLSKSSLRRLVGQVSRLNMATLKDDDNLFAAGLDSLHVVHLVYNLNEAIGRRYVEPAMIYTNPTITKMANALQPKRDFHVKNSRERNSKIGDVFESFSIGLPKARFSGPRVALLTGSTGGLGSYLLKRLASDRRFIKIYCLVRTMPDSPPSDDLNVTYLQCDFSDPQLGLSYDVYTDLLRTVTHILHNAWQVDFNLSLESFDVHLRGVRHLIDFSARSAHTAHFFFISSIAAVLNASSSPVKEIVYDDSSVAQSIGYGESKHIAERLLYQAGVRSNVTSSICRIGQVAGPVLEGGVWNKREWLPSLIESSKHMGCIPDSLGAVGRIDWIPVDVLAQIICELFVVENHNSKTDVFHVVNPTPVEWTSLLPVILDYLGPSVETVSISAWTERLLASTNILLDVWANPAVKLLDFFQRVSYSEEKKFPIMDITNARAYSETLAGLGPVRPEWMLLWLKQWKY